MNPKIMACSALSLALLAPLSHAQNKPAAKPAPQPAAKPAPPGPTLPKGPAGVAATVNGERIPEAEVQRRITRYRSLEKSLQTDSPEAKQALQNIRSSVIDEMITWSLLVQEAKKQKIVPAPAKVDEAVAQFKKNFKDDNDMKEQLAKEGKKPNDIRQLMTEGMQVKELQGRWMADASVTEAEIAKFYRDNIAEFGVPEGVSARHILLAFGPNPTEADKIALKKRADDLLAQAKTKGVDFGELAQKNSDDKGSAARGGDLGPFPRGVMDKAFEDAAFGAREGEIVGPIETVYGYHIIKVENKIAARTLPLADSREDIRPFLLEQKRQKMLESKLSDVLKVAKIQKYA